MWVLIKWDEAVGNNAQSKLQHVCWTFVRKVADGKKVTLFSDGWHAVSDLR
jgi:hypothetical protein